MQGSLMGMASLLLNILILIIMGCSSEKGSTPTPLPEFGIIEENGKTILVDLTGKEWDITHARKKYGMEPDKFEFGLGPNAIRPIIFPKMLVPSDEGYPKDDDIFFVLGAKLNDEARAYPMETLTKHEIANDVFVGPEDIHVAFAF